MYVTITCSNCGNHRRISNKKMEYTVKAINDGWGSFGAALYCPECSKTWDDRNPGRPMPGERNTFFVIMNRILQERDERNERM